MTFDSFWKNIGHQTQPRHLRFSSTMPKSRNRSAEANARRTKARKLSKKERRPNETTKSSNCNGEQSHSPVSFGEEFDASKLHPDILELFYERCPFEWVGIEVSVVIEEMMSDPPEEINLRNVVKNFYNSYPEKDWVSDWVKELGFELPEERELRVRSERLKKLAMRNRQGVQIPFQDTLFRGMIAHAHRKRSFKSSNCT